MLHMLHIDEVHILVILNQTNSVRWLSELAEIHNIEKY